MAEATPETQTRPREPETAQSGSAVDPLDAAILAQDTAESQHLAQPDSSAIPIDAMELGAPTATPDSPEASPPAMSESVEPLAAPEVVPDETVAEPPPEPEPEDDPRTVGVTAPRHLVGGSPDINVPDQPVDVNNRYQVFPARPIPELDSPSARAYEALDRQDSQIRLMALVPLPGIPVRRSEIDEILGHQIPGILALIDTGVAEWPHFGRQALVLLFERPIGGRVVDVFKSDLPDFKKVDVARALVDSVLKGLRQLASRGLVHHAIRPDNLFFMDEEQTQIAIGEFVSAPPSFDQPVAFETIERAMAAEPGRGVGNLSDDLYSFGATLAFLVQNQNPVRGMSKEDLILAKIVHSSHQTLVGRHMLTIRFLELIRGLLADDPTQRWGYDEIDQWMNGRRVAPTQSTVVRAQRPFRFGNVDHIQPRSLAYVMSRRRESAIKLIKDGTLETWVLRGLDDKEMASSIRGRVEFAESEKNPEDKDELLLTRVLLVLDSLAPVSYKTLTFFPGGVGALLAMEMMHDGDIRTLAEALQRDVPQIWFEAQIGGMAQNFGEQTNFQRLRLNLQKMAAGYGLERILYEMNTGLACKSPLLSTAYVSDIEDLLPALNDAERHVDSKQKPIDRHLAAFIAARAGSDTENFIDAFADRDEAVSSMAVLKLYSHLQSRHGPDVLLGLTRWIGGQVGAIIRLYHSRATRQQLESEIPSIVRRGRLPELLAVLDNAELRHNDRTGFTAAVTEFQKAEAEINEVLATSRPSSDHVQRTARKVAAVLSISLMVAFVSLMIMAG